MLASAQVLDAIAARITGLPLAGARVYTSRAWPLDVLPAVRVVSPDEDIEQLTVHNPAVQKHALQVELQGYLQATDDLDDAMHALASELLTALFNDPGTPDALSTIGNDVVLAQRRIERAMAKEGQADIGLIQITLRASFSTRSNAPDTLI
jgi:hypothetical protein